jgi:hypothetical protein
MVMRFRIGTTGLSTLFLYVFSVALLSGCATIRTGYHYDETQNFGLYNTFSWIADSPYVRAEGESAPMVDPLTQSKIARAIRGELERKGYTFVENRASADFVIGFTVGGRERITVDSYPTVYRGPWGWHVYGSYYYVHEYRAHTYTLGTLGVDIFDGKSRKPVWHGWAEKAVTTSDRQDPTPAINEAVREMFVGFPR